MSREIYAICPRCGKRAVIVSHRWDWDADRDMARLKCICGSAEVPFEESRVLDINLNNPYVKQTQFKLLIPAGYDREDLWNKIGNCLMMGWSDG